MNLEDIDYHTIIKIAHITFNGPLLLYISLAKPTNIYIYYFLLLVGLAVLYTTLSKIMNNRGYKWLYIHLLIFVPVILRVSYLGIKEEKIPYYLFSFLQAMGIGAVGHHLINLFTHKH